MGKVFKWIKLTDKFLFSDLKIKKLRKLAGGDTYTIIYLKMLLLAKNTSGIIEYEEIENSIEEEIALKIDEDLDNIKVTLNYLSSVNLLEIIENTNNIYFPQAQEFVGSESESAERVRKFRERQKRKKELETQVPVMLEENNSKGKALQCNANVTDSNEAIAICNDNCNANVTGCNQNVTLEKEREKDIEIDKDIDKELYAQNDKPNPESKVGESKTHFERWEEQFYLFYSKYPKKVTKPLVEKWFEKNRPNEDLFKTMLEKLELFKKTYDWTKQNGQFIPYPSTWLNQKRWEDEIDLNTMQTNQNGFKQVGNTNVMQMLQKKLDEERAKNKGGNSNG